MSFSIRIFPCACKNKQFNRELQIFANIFLQMSIGATTKNAHTSAISITFSTTYAPKHIFTSYLRFLKASYGFPKKSKNIKHKLFPVFLGRISFFVYFCPRNEKNRGRILWTHQYIYPKIKAQKLKLLWNSNDELS